MLARHFQPKIAPGAPHERPSVVGLVRVSTFAQSEDGGLLRQYSVINKTVERKGLNLIKIFEVVDVSGTDVLRCPAILELLRLVETKAVQGICVADLDRLFRPDKPGDYAILGVFQTTGAIIYCGDSELDLSTKNGMLFGQIRSAISGFELSIMKERQEGGKNEKRIRGKCPTNRLTMPMGTQFDRALDKWVYTPEIGMVRELFRLFDEESLHNYSELSRRTGLNHATIRVILKNPIYTGWRVTHQKRGEKRISKTGKTYRVKVPRPEEDVIRVRVFEDPAVSQETFDRVQAQIAKTTFNHNDRFRSHDQINLGAGLTFCGHCGEPIFYTSKKRDGVGGYAMCKANHYQYRKILGGCKQRNLRKADLDNALIQLAGKVFGDAAHLAGMIMASISRQRSVIKPLVGVGSQSALAAELNRRDARLLQAFEGGALTVEELRSRRADIRKQLDQLRGAAARQEGNPDNGVLESARLIVKSGLRFRAIKDPGEQKHAITQTFAKFILRDTHLIAFEFNDRVLPPGSPLMRQQILLEELVAITRPPEALPDGCRRCIKCNQVKPEEGFYPRRNSCRGCLREMARHRYLTVRKVKAVPEVGQIRSRIQLDESPQRT